MPALTPLLLAALLFADDPPAKPAADPALAERYRQIVREFDDRQAKAEEAQAKAGSLAESIEIYERMRPDDVAYSRRMIELAESNPGDPTARDALIWVLDKSYRVDAGPYGEQFGRAVGLLVEHHADDPEVARLGLQMFNLASRRRDAFLEGVYANAEGREAKGLARMALARYLERKADLVDDIRAGGVPRTYSYQGLDDQGKPAQKTGNWSNEEIAYRTGLLLFDSAALRREAERLYEEAVAGYGDIPFVTRQRLKLEAKLRERPPATIADPKEREEMGAIERRLASTRRTLREEAESRLDALRHLAIGKPAPEIDGIGLDGKPLKLSDYRGKVVALVFWGSWCGPCMREVPGERELVERLKARPFALLGVDCEEDRADGLKAVESERMAWPHWFDGAPGLGPIVKRYHVQSFPSTFLLDAKGVIRFKGLRGESLGEAVEQLLGEAEAKP